MVCCRGSTPCGVLHQIFNNRVQHAIKNWTQSDLRFCQIEGQKDLKINEKGGQLDRKSRRKLTQNDLKQLNNTFWWKIWHTLGPRISGSKSDRDKLIVFCIRGGQSDCDEAWNRDPIGLKISKMWVITAEPPYHAEVWEYPPLGVHIEDYALVYWHS